MAGASRIEGERRIGGATTQKEMRTPPRQSTARHSSSPPAREHAGKGQAPGPQRGRRPPKPVIVGSLAGGLARDGVATKPVRFRGITTHAKDFPVYTPAQMAACVQSQSMDHDDIDPNGPWELKPWHKGYEEGDSGRFHRSSYETTAKHSYTRAAVDPRYERSQSMKHGAFNPPRRSRASSERSSSTISSIPCGRRNVARMHEMASAGSPSLFWKGSN